MLFAPNVAGGMARDVTEGVESDRALAESETHFRALVENGPDIISIVSTDGMICYHSPSAVLALRCSPQELVGVWFLFLGSSDGLILIRTRPTALKRVVSFNRWIARFNGRTFRRIGAFVGFSGGEGGQGPHQPVVIELI